MYHIDIPIYPQSREYAKRNREHGLWTESHKANLACAKAIDAAIKKGHDGVSLDESCAKGVIERFGHDRVQLVLAIAVKMDSAQTSERNAEWAGRIRTNHIGKAEAVQYHIGAHPAVLDTFITQAREAYDALGLFNHNHCDGGYTSDVNYEGQVLALKPSLLPKRGLAPENQLVLAKGGFGCKLGSLGKIFGEVLYSGAQEIFCRADFIGVLRQEHMPQWALEKLNLDAPELSQDSGPEQTLGM